MGDVVVITGASGGVGRATARRFAQDGARIAFLARGGPFDERAHAHSLQTTLSKHRRPPGRSLPASARSPPPPPC